MNDGSCYIGVFVKETENSYSVYFPDIPEAVTGGHSIAECIVFGTDILQVCLTDALEEGRLICTPTPCSQQEAERKVREIRAEDGLDMPESVIYQYFPIPLLR